jgi:hypothetical protein
MPNDSTDTSNEVAALCGPTKSRVCLATVASNADVLHSSGCKFGPKVTNCEFSYALDDYLNIHTRTQVCVADDSSGGLVIADPRLRADVNVPDDHPYGTVESMSNVRPGDTLSFRDVNTLELIHQGAIATVRRIPPSDPAVAAAQAVVDGLKVTVGAHFNPSDVTAALPAGGRLSRVWAVTLVPATGPQGAHVSTPSLEGTMVGIDDWSNSGGVFANNFLHSSIDGVRWKSNNGMFVNNTWAPAVSFTGLEVTPLRSFYEGPFAVSNVLIAGNTFVGGKESLISMCTGMSHQTKPPWSTCTNVTVRDNKYPPLHT